MKRPAEAARIAREGLARVGDEFELYDALGVALGDLREHEAAVEALCAAVARNPGDSNSNYNLAVAPIALRRLDETIDALHRSLTLRPTFPASLVLLAQVEIDSGRWKSAAQYLQPLHDSHPEMPQARQMMAYWHLRSGTEAEDGGDRVTAERHYHSGLSIDPNYTELADATRHPLPRCRTLPRGRCPLEAYRRLQPDNPQSSLFLGQIYAAVGRGDDARRILTEGAQIAERAGNATTAPIRKRVLLARGSGACWSTSNRRCSRRQASRRRSSFMAGCAGSALRIVRMATDFARPCASPARPWPTRRRRSPASGSSRTSRFRRGTTCSMSMRDSVRTSPSTR